MRGITGDAVVGYQHVVVMQFDEVKMKIPVIFAEHDTVPRILGREGVFPNFGILFDEAKRRIVFLDAVKERKRIDPLFE